MKPKQLIIIKYTLLLAGAIFLYACHKPIPLKNEINKIEIAREYGNKHELQEGIIIDSTLTYKFFGGSENKTGPKGGYEGKITQAFWDTLNIKLKQINLKRLLWIPSACAEVMWKLYFTGADKNGMLLII